MAKKKVSHVRKIPMRQCIGCSEQKEKKNLIRIIKTPENEICIDFSGKKNGRGAYICNSVECLRIAKKKHSLERSLKTTIPEEIYDELERKLENGEDR